MDIPAQEGRKRIHSSLTFLLHLGPQRVEWCQPALSIYQNKMLMSSRNTLRTTPPEIIPYQLSGDPLTQSSLSINITITEPMDAVGRRQPWGPEWGEEGYRGKVQCLERQTKTPRVKPDGSVAETFFWLQRTQQRMRWTRSWLPGSWHSNDGKRSTKLVNRWK